MEVLTEFLLDLVLGIIAVLAVYACRAVDHFAERTVADIENEQAKRYATEITRAVSDAVKCTCQTYVDELKEAKSFTKEAQAEAMKRSLTTALKSISPEAIEFIQNVYGDVEPYLTAKIEAAVREQRKIFVY